MRKTAIVIGMMVGLQLMMAMPLMTQEAAAVQYDYTITNISSESGWYNYHIYSYPDNMQPDGFTTSSSVIGSTGTSPYDIVGRGFTVFDLGFFEGKTIDHATLSFWVYDWYNNVENVTIGVYSSDYIGHYEWNCVDERIGSLVNTSELYPFDYPTKSWAMREISMEVPGEYLRDLPDDLFQIALVAEPEIYSGLAPDEYAGLEICLIPGSYTYMKPTLDVQLYDGTNDGNWVSRCLVNGGWTFGTGFWYNTNGTWPLSLLTAPNILTLPDDLTTTNCYVNSNMWVGSEVDIVRMWVSFDTSSIPDDAVITGATITTRVNGWTTGNEFNLSVYNAPLIASDFTTNTTCGAGPFEFAGTICALDLDGEVGTKTASLSTYDFIDPGNDITLMFADQNEVDGIAPIPDIGDGEKCFIYLASQTVQYTYLDVEYYLEPSSNPPVADAGSNQFTPITAVVDFDGSESSDDFAIVNYSWAFTYNGTSVTLYGETPSYEFDIAGIYNVTLTVTDEHDNNDTDIVAIIVYSSSGEEEEEPPVPEEEEEGGGGGLIFTLVADFDYTVNGTMVSFIDTSTGPNTVIAWYWDFGDEERTTMENPTHEYDRVGSYTVTLTVVDSNGRTSSLSQTILVDESQGFSINFSLTAIALCAVGLAFIIIAVMFRNPALLLVAGLSGAAMLVVGLASMFGVIGWL